MSIGFQHPNVKVHVGDGFEFLKNRQNEFDVIITDSSDPEGPAESLFQKPYFELLRDALRDGGVITTQGCSSPFLLAVFSLLFLNYLSSFCIYFSFDLSFLLYLVYSLSFLSVSPSHTLPRFPFLYIIMPLTSCFEQQS